MTPTVSDEERLNVKAEALVRDWRSWWPAWTVPGGRPYFVIPSEDGPPSSADAHYCTCPDHTFRKRDCKHMRAVRLWCRAYYTGAFGSWVPPSRPSWKLPQEPPPAARKLPRELPQEPDGRPEPPVWLEEGDVWEAG